MKKAKLPGMTDANLKAVGLEKHCIGLFGGILRENVMTQSEVFDSYVSPSLQESKNITKHHGLSLWSVFNNAITVCFINMKKYYELGEKAHTVYTFLTFFFPL